MADKLSESTWTGFLKKNKIDVDDGALLKALARFDKTDDSRPEPHVVALEELVEQLKKQVPLLVKKKKELGDKPFTLAKDKVNELLDLAERQLKEAQKAKSAAASDEEDEDSPALIGSKMVPLLRELCKPDVRMHALICTAGKETALLVMRRPIGAARRKLLAEAVDAKGGAKYIVGECLYEKNALTFVVQAAAGGLAKRLRAALLAQTALRLKVRVRGEDGQEDDDGEPDDAAAAEDQSPSTPGEAAADPLKARYEARAAALADRVATALRQPQGDVSRLRAVNLFASEKAQAGAYAAALQALDAVEKLIQCLDDRVNTALKNLNPVTPQQSAAHTSKELSDLEKSFFVKFDDFRRMLADMLKDPNGILLARKKISTFGAIAASLLRNNPEAETCARIKATVEELVKISEQTKKIEGGMSAYIKSRIDVLGRDEANKKYVLQEGEVGAEIEMGLGGLKRAQGAEIEFEPGDFSPYKKARGADQNLREQADVEAGVPHQFDVFGLTKDAVKSAMLGQLIQHTKKQMDNQEKDFIWKQLKTMKSSGTILFSEGADPVEVNPFEMFEAYLTKNPKKKNSRTLIDSLKDHFKKGGKPTIVPLDMTGMAEWPLLKDWMKEKITNSFPADQLSLILWRE